MIIRILAAFCMAAVTLAAQGGEKISRPVVTAQSAASAGKEPAVMVPKRGPDPRRNTDTVPGIDGIPLGTVKVTNGKMADMFAIIEPKLGEGIAHSPAGVLRTPHSDMVRVVACRSYIRACGDPFGPDTPFRLYLGERYPEGLPERGSYEQVFTILENLPESVKIVSASFHGYGTAEMFGPHLPFAIIQSVGNGGTSSPFFLDDRGEWIPFLMRYRENITASIDAGRHLFVAGYDTAKAADGVYVRDTDSNGCRGVRSCIWAPFTFRYPSADAHRGPFHGTSAGAPHVAAALASVMAATPDMTPEELVRLAMECAIPTPSLPGGVGRADFTCMTDMVVAGVHDSDSD